MADSRRWAQLRARLRRRRPDPDARLSSEQVIAITDRINELVREEHAVHAERRANGRGHHR